MKLVRAITIVPIAFGAAAWAASPPASDSIIVAATNGGAVNFSISIASYNFGTVNANGGANAGGTQSLTGVTNASGATYTATTATTWRASSAPAATIYIYNGSTGSSITWGTASRLKVRLPTTNLSAGSVSCGFKTFTTTGDGTSTGSGSGNLIRNVVVKNGANAAIGNIDFRLTVNNIDALGDNTWVVTLTEVGL